MATSTLQILCDCRWAQDLDWSSSDKHAKFGDVYLLQGSAEVRQRLRWQMSLQRVLMLAWRAAAEKLPSSGCSCWHQVPASNASTSAYWHFWHSDCQ